jgi:regulator of nucleoside diphosphate kinase
MNRNQIVITEPDFEKLERLLESSHQNRPHDAQHLQMLEEELRKAVIVDSAKIPHDVVTMNSRVRVLDLKTRHEFVCQIVFPRAANPERNQISVLAPIGTALLGYRAGDSVEWQVPGGTRRLHILEVEYQPEAAGRAA